MKDLKITYTDSDGIRVTLTRDEDTDWECRPNSDITGDLASIAVRLVRESGVSASHFYDTLRESMEYEFDGFKEHLDELAAADARLGKLRENDTNG